MKTILISRRRAHAIVTEMKRAGDTVKVTVDNATCSFQSRTLKEHDAGDLLAVLPCAEGTDISASLDIAVSTKALLGALSPKRDGVVSLRRDDKAALVLGVDGMSASLYKSPGSFESVMDKVTPSEMRQLAAHESSMLDELAWVHRAVCKDTIRKNLCCVLLEYDKHGKATLVAVDGYRMHVARSVEPGGGPQSEEQVMIEDAIIATLLRCGKSDSGDVVISHSDMLGERKRDAYSIEVGATWALRCVSEGRGTFPAWSNLVACYLKTLLSHIVDAKLLVGAVKKIRAMGGGMFQAVQLDLSSKDSIKLSLAGEHDDVGDCSLEIDSRRLGEAVDAKIIINAQYIVETFSSGEVELSFGGKLEPLVIRQGDRVAYVMPYAQ